MEADRKMPSNLCWLAIRIRPQLRLTWVVSLTRVLAIEWAKYNVSVNSVSPGTTITEGVAAKLDRLKWGADRVPMQRFGQPEEVANLVLFLASPETTYITGQDFIIDGGTCALLATYVELK